MDDPKQLFDLTGRVACITGASSGLGRRAALALIGAGARVVGVARRKDALAGLVAETGGKAAALPADIADRAAVPGLAAEIAAPFGPPDILIVQDKDLGPVLQSAIDSDEMTIIVCKCDSGNIKLPVITLDPVVIRHRFMEAVKA